MKTSNPRFWSLNSSNLLIKQYLMSENSQFPALVIIIVQVLPVNRFSAGSLQKKKKKQFDKVKLFNFFIYFSNGSRTERESLRHYVLLCCI